VGAGAASRAEHARGRLIGLRVSPCNSN
jgi:hypothetical protein